MEVWSPLFEGIFCTLWKIPVEKYLLKNKGLNPLVSRGFLRSFLKYLLWNKGMNLLISRGFLRLCKNTCWKIKASTPRPQVSDIPAWASFFLGCYFQWGFRYTNPPVHTGLLTCTCLLKNKNQQMWWNSCTVSSSAHHGFFFCAPRFLLLRTTVSHSARHLSTYQTKKKTLMWKLCT
jgi:hypothetical protein